MLTEVKVPGFPESVTDGVIAAWHKRPGDAVKRDETLVDIETDKVLFEVPAPADGTLAEVLQQEGATVTAGQLLARIEARTDATASRAPSPPGNGAVAAAPIISPSAGKLMAEHGLAPGSVTGSGKDGRVLKEDVLRVLAAQPGPAAARTSPESIQESAAESAAESASEPAPRPAPGRSPAVPGTLVDLPAEERLQRRVPMTRLRARIAERLVEAQQTAAILTTFNEVNMQPVIQLRQHYRERFEQEHGVKLGFMSFFVKAAVEALKRYPVINASLEGNDVVYHGFFDIGIAVASPRGLVVPVLRDADRCGMAEIERRVAGFAEKAQAGSLSLEEITGGTFTITNGGVFGSLLSTPILNPPQSAILGMHRIQQRPVVEEGGAIVARPMMYLALSYDHRLIDGREAVQFLVAIKDLLEDPARLLLEI
jgi:2-oxoglutarate dehydrogenase E2 component (dihydrolipoamide succinyltransferase)